MPNYWLLKTEPSAYSYDRLQRDGRAVWDGVTNPVALKNLRAMQAGDAALIYHTGAEKAAVGVAEIVSAAYPDPKAKDPRLVVVDLRPKRKLRKPVPLAGIKADPAFQDHPLVRLGRLSVVPLTAAQWARLLKMGDEP
jgi:predicted RNA-binding protein with PUA-like domain